MIDVILETDTLETTTGYEIERYNDTRYRFYMANGRYPNDQERSFHAVFGRYPDQADHQLGLGRVLRLQEDIQRASKARQLLN